MSSNALQFEKERGVTEVGVTRGIAHVTIHFSDITLVGRRLSVLRRFAEANLPVFLVKLLPLGISFALRQPQITGGVALLDTLTGELGLRYILRDDLALVTTRAGAMRDLSGIMATIYDALVAQDVAVRQTGDAYNAVHCLVPGEAADRAAAALRTSFALNSESAGQEPADEQIAGLPKAL